MYCREVRLIVFVFLPHFQWRHSIPWLQYSRPLLRSQNTRFVPVSHLILVLNHFYMGSAQAFLTKRRSQRTTLLNNFPYLCSSLSSGYGLFKASFSIDIGTERFDPVRGSNTFLKSGLFFFCFRKLVILHADPNG